MSLLTSRAKRLGVAIATGTAILFAMPTFASAQWLSYPTPGIPRTADGRPDLAARAPRTPAGHPDLSGVWRAPNLRYFFDITVDGVMVPYQPWAQALFEERQANNQKDHPRARSLPIGLPQMVASPFPVKLIQSPELLVILYEAENTFRQIFLDGRELPRDPEPSWRGYSIGHWDGDDLLVETIGFNGKNWVDYAGRPESEALHLIERYTRRDFGHMSIQVTIDDPKAYTKPWTVTEDYVYLADTDLLEEVCLENEKDVEHLVGK